MATLWPLEEGEAEELFALPAADRAIQFFQLLADWEEAWGLKDAQGWVVDKKSDALPLCPLLAAESLSLAVFPSPTDPGLLLSPIEAADRLESELQIAE
jgi:hypothetical protein